ncbi:hypothetical protein ACWDOP_22495 [Nocardia sp. NPDC003693]
MSTPPNEPQSGSGDFLKKEKSETPEQPATPPPATPEPSAGGYTPEPYPQGAPEPYPQSAPNPYPHGAPGQYPPPGYPDPQYPQGAPPPQGDPYPAGGVYNYPPMGGQPQGSQPGYPAYPQQGQPYPPQGGYPAYPQQPGQPYQPYGAPPPQSGTQIFSIIGFVCAAIALLFCPFGFGIAAIVLGVVGNSKGEKLGKWAAIAGGVCMVLGLIFAFIVLGSDGLVPTDN